MEMRVVLFLKSMIFFCLVVYVECRIFPILEYNVVVSND